MCGPFCSVRAATDIPLRVGRIDAEFRRCSRHQLHHADGSVRRDCLRIEAGFHVCDRFEQSWRKLHLGARDLDQRNCGEVTRCLMLCRTRGPDRRRAFRRDYDRTRNRRGPARPNFDHLGGSRTYRRKHHCRARERDAKRRRSNSVHAPAPNWLKV
jgi:hypothetical protein